MKILLYVIPVLIISVLASFFLFNVQIQITEFSLEIIICSVIVIMSLSLIALMVIALNKPGLDNANRKSLKND